MITAADINGLVALVNQGRLEEAEHNARMRLRTHPDAGMLWKILSVTLLRQGKDALAALHRTVQLMPQDGEAHGNLGAALHDRKQWTEALVSLQRALAIRPDDIQALVDAANATRALGRAHEAVSLYRRALALEPRHAEARNNLGNAFLDLGQPEDAAGCYRRALEIEPNNAQIHCNLGDALRQLARREEAVASYRQALQGNPGNIEALNNLGHVLCDLGESRQAAALHMRAIELEPGRAESHCHLGHVLLERRQVDEAAQSFRRALALKPEYVLAHLGLAAALRHQARPADAEANCRAALALDADCAQGRWLLGELLADRGQFAAAEELFRGAIAADPQLASAYCSIAAHRKMTAEDTSWRQGAEALLATPLPVAHEIGLHYAFGKYCDDVGRYDQAFEHYRRANKLAKRGRAPYDGAKLTRRVAEIIRCVDAQFVRRCQPVASDSELPVFIVGMPRSGTSLTEQILASHPAVFGAGELAFWHAAFNAALSAGAKGGAETLIAATAADYLERATASCGAASRVIDKMPANFLYAGLIHAAFPRARIIHLRRDPIDTCLSIYFQNFFKVGPYCNDLDDLVHYYREYLRISDHWRALLPASALLEIPYEALLEDQEGWTRRMLDFVGLPWDPKCLAFHETERVVITASKWQVRQRMHTASAGRWRNYEAFIGPLRQLRNLENHP